MMLGLRRRVRIETERMTLRLPAHADCRTGPTCARASAAFLTPWEPVWAHDHLSRKAFTNRVYWAQRAEGQGTALPLLMIRRDDGALLGAITLDNIRRGPAQAGTLGYWVGAAHARQGYMREAILAVIASRLYQSLDLSRLEAACLPENAASRGVLEKCGFKYEGRRAKLSADQRPLAQPCALRQPARRPARAHRGRLTAQARDRPCLRAMSFPNPGRCRCSACFCPCYASPCLPPRRKGYPAIASPCRKRRRMEFLHKASFGAGLTPDRVRLSYVAHASFVLETAGGLVVATDYTGILGLAIWCPMWSR